MHFDKSLLQIENSFYKQKSKNMKKTLFLIGFVSLGSLGIVSAQNTDTLLNNRQEVIDSISNIKTLDQAEKQQLNKDYQKATDNLSQDQGRELIDSNRNEVKKVRRNARINGVTPESRERVEKRYKQGRRETIDSVRNQ